jgi:hypothetical protein
MAPIMVAVLQAEKDASKLHLYSFPDSALPPLQSYQV